jgi:drug/metabolite transporter (DMT)-like permease
MVSSNLRILSFLSLVAVQLSLAFVYKLSAKQGKFEYSPASAIATAEFIKLTFCALGVFRQSLTTKVRPFCCLELKAVCWILFLSILYAVNNQFSFWLLKDGDVATFTLFKSSAPMVTALLRQQVFGASMCKLQWFCILVQCCGMILLEYSPCNGSSLYPMAVYVGNVFACLITSSSSVINEYVLKTMDSTLLEQNTLLYGFGVLLNSILFFASPISDSKNDFFHGYDWMAALVIFLNSLIGLAISMVYKYADAVVKTFAQPVVTSLALIFSWIFLDMNVSFGMWVAAFLLTSNVYMYMDCTINPPNQILPTEGPTSCAPVDSVGRNISIMTTKRRFLLVFFGMVIGCIVFASWILFSEPSWAEQIVSRRSTWGFNANVSKNDNFVSVSSEFQLCDPLLQGNRSSVLIVADLDSMLVDSQEAVLHLEEKIENLSRLLAAESYMVVTSQRCSVPAFLSLPWLPITIDNCAPFAELANNAVLKAMRACCFPISLITAYLPSLVNDSHPTLPEDTGLLYDAMLIRIAQGLMLDDLKGKMVETAATAGAAVVIARPGAVAAAAAVLCAFGQRSDDSRNFTEFPNSVSFAVDSMSWEALFRLWTLDEWILNEGRRPGDQPEGLFINTTTLLGITSNCTSSGTFESNFDKNNCSGVNWLLAIETNRTASSLVPLVPEAAPGLLFSARDERHRRNLDELVQQIMSPESKFGNSGAFTSVKGMRLHLGRTSEQSESIKHLVSGDVLGLKPFCGSSRVAVVITGQLRTILDCLMR